MLMDCCFTLTLPSSPSVPVYLTSASFWSYKAAASKLNPTIGTVTFTIGPTKKPVLLEASKTSSLKDMLVTFKPPFKPNLIWALAFAANSMAATRNTIDKTFFIFSFLFILLIKNILILIFNGVHDELLHVQNHWKKRNYSSVGES